MMDTNKVKTRRGKVIGALILCEWMCTSLHPLWKTIGIIPSKFEDVYSLWFSISTLRYCFIDFKADSFSLFNISEMKCILIVNEKAM